MFFDLLLFILVTNNLISIPGNIYNIDEIMVDRVKIVYNVTLVTTCYHGNSKCNLNV